VTYFNTIKKLFLEANQLLGLTFDNIDYHLNVVSNNLLNSLPDINNASDLSNYGTQFMRMYKGFIQSIQLIIEERVEEYEMDESVVIRSFLNKLKDDTTTLVDMLFSSKESFETFEKSPLKEITDGFLDSMKDKEFHRAMLFLIVHMIRHKTEADLLGKAGFRD
jgi:hypothetical protein